MFSSTFCVRFALKAGLFSLLSLVSLFGARSASAAVLNGSFESGDFTGWETLGQTSIKTSAYGSGSTEGSYQALLSTFCPKKVDNLCKKDGNFLELTQFLNVNPNDLVALGDVFEGSAIETTFTVRAGDVLTFDWNFLTDSKNGDALGLFNDFTFVTLSRSINKLADTYSPLVGAFTATNFQNQTGFETFSYTFTTAGRYTLGIGVVDVGDGANDSALLVDNVLLSRTVTPSRVPEPASVLGVLAFGACAIGARRLPKAHCPNGRSRRS